MPFQIPIDASEAIKSVHAFASSVDKASESLTRTAKKGEGDFKGLSGSMKVAFDQIKRTMRDVDSFGGLGQVTTDIRSLEKISKDLGITLTKMEQRLVSLTRANDSYNQSVHLQLSNAKVQEARDKAQIDVITKTEIALEQERAAYQMLGQEQGKQLVLQRQLRQEQERLLRAQQQRILRSNELKSSIVFLNSEQGRQQAQLAEVEKVTKRYNALLAQESKAYQDVASKVALLETAQRKINSGATGSSTGSSWTALAQHLNTLTGGAWATNNAVQALRSTLYGMGASFGIFTSSTLLVSAAVYGLVGEIRRVITVGTEFQDAIYRVAAITTGANSSMGEFHAVLGQLDERAISVAASSRFMASEVASAMNELAMAGLRADDVITSVSSTMNLAMIGAIGFGEAADIATNIMMGFQLGVADLEGVIDKMAMAATSSNQSISQLGNALSYVAPIAASFGVDLSLVTASTEILANAGIKASRAGTALRRILISLFTPTKKGADAFKSIGVAVDEASESMQGMEMLDAPLKGLVDSGGADQVMAMLRRLYLATDGATKNLSLLTDTVGVRAVSAFAQLVKSIGAGDKSLQSLMADLDMAGGATEQMSRKIMESVKSDWLVFLSAIEAVRQRLFDLMGTDLSGWLKSAANSLQAFARNKSYLESMGKAVLDVASAVLKLIGVFIGLKLVSSLSAMVYGFSAALIAANKNVLAFVKTLLLARGGMAALTAATATATATSFGARAATAAAAAYFALKTSVTAAFFVMARSTATLGTATTAMLALQGALKGVGAALLFLIKRIAIPVAIVTTLYTVLDYYTGIGDAISKAYRSLVGFNREAEETRDAIADEAIQLVDEGGLSDLYRQKSVLEQLIRLKETDVMVGQAPGTDLEGLIAQYTSLTSEISKAHEVIKNAGTFSWRVDNDKAKQDVEEAQGILESLEGRLERAKEKLADIQTGNGGMKFFSYFEELGASAAISTLTSQVEKQKKQVEDLGNVAKDAMYKYALSAGTTEEVLSRLGITAEGAAEKLQAQIAVVRQLESEYSYYTDLRNAVLSAGGDPKAAKVLQEHVDTIATAVEAATPKVHRLQEEVNLLNSILDKKGKGEPTTLKELGDYVDALSRKLSEVTNKFSLSKELSETVDISVSIGKIAFSKEGADATLKKITEEISDALSSGASPQIVKDLQSQAANLQTIIRELEMGASVEAMQSLQDWRADLDSAYASAEKFAVSVIKLNQLSKSAGLQSKDYARILSSVVGSTLKLDDATGQLNEESLRAVEITKDLLEAEKQRLQNSIEDVTMQLNIEVNSQDPKKIPELRDQLIALRAQLEAMDGAMTLMNGDLAATVKQMTSTSESSKRLKDQYAEQIEILKLLGKEIEATRKERERESEGVEGTKKAYLDLKYVLEDLSKAREKAFETADLTSGLQEDFDTINELLGSDVFGNVVVNWFDPTQTADNVDALISEVSKAFTATNDLSAEADKVIQEHYANLGGHIETLGQQALEAISKLREEAAKPIEYAWGNSSGGAKDIAPDPAELSGAGMPSELVLTWDIQPQFDYNQEVIDSLLRDITDSLASGVAANSIKMSFDGVDFSLQQVGDSFSLVANRAGEFENALVASANRVDQARGQVQDLASQALAAAVPITQLKDAATQLSEVNTALDVPVDLSQLERMNAAIGEVEKKIGSDVFNIRLNVSGDEKIAALGDRLSTLREEMIKSGKRLSEISKQYGAGVLSEIDAEKAMRNERDKLKTVTDKYKGTVEELIELDTKQLENGDKLRSAYQKNSRELEALSKQYSTLSAKQQELNKSRSDMLDLVDANLMTDKEFADNMEEASDAIISAGSAWGKYWVDTKNDISSVSEVMIDLTDDVRGKLVDALVDGGELKLDDFVDLIKRKLAEVAVNTLIVNIVGNIAGITGTGGSLASLLTGGSATGSAASSISSGSGLLSGLSGLSSIGTKVGSAWSWLQSDSLAKGASNLFGTGSMIQNGNTGLYGVGPFGLSGSGSTATAAGASNLATIGAGLAGGLAGYFLSDTLFDGQYVSTGSSLGGLGGAALGASYLSVVPGLGTAVGALLGSVAGGWLGSLFGDNEPRFGGYATSFSGTGLEDNVSASGSFGLNFGVSDKGSKNIDASEYQDTLNGLATVSDYISGFFGEEISGIVEGGLQGVLGNFNDWGNDLDTYFASLFGTIINLGADAVEGGDDVGSALAAAMQGLGGLGGTTQQMASQIEDGIAIVQSAAALFGTQFGDLLGFGAGGVYDDLSKASAALGGYVAEFRVGAETVSEAISRLSTDAIALTTAMGIAGQSLQDFIGSGHDFIEAATGFVDKLGYYGSSLETLASQQDAYYSTFFSEEEQAALARSAALAQVDALNAALGLTGTAMVRSGADLRRFVEGLDLTTDAGQDAYIQAMNSVEAFKTLSTELADTTAQMLSAADAQQKVIDAFNAMEDKRDSIFETLSPDEFTLEQIKEFRAGLDSVGLSSNMSANALLGLVKAGALSAEQIEYLSENLGTLRDWSDSFSEPSKIDRTTEIEAALNGWRLGTAFDWQGDVDRRTVNYQYPSKALQDDAYLAHVMHAYTRNMQWFESQLRKYGKASTQYAKTLSKRILDLVTNNFFDLYLSKFDLSLGDATPANALGAALSNLAPAFGKLNQEIPVTAEQFSAMWAALKATPLSRDSIYALGQIAQNLDAMDTVFTRVAEFVDWLGIETSALNDADAARDKLTALFDSFGMAVPATKESLAELVDAGTLSNAQLLELAQNQGYLETYFASVSDDVTQAAQAMETALQNLSDALLAAADKLLAQTSSATIGRRADAQVMLERALATAQSSGLLPDPTEFQSVLDALTASATSGYSSRSEYLADQARIRAMLLELEAYTGANDASALVVPSVEFPASVPEPPTADQQRAETAQLSAALEAVRAELAQIKLESRAQHAESARLQRRTADTLEGWDLNGMPPETTA